MEVIVGLTHAEIIDGMEKRYASYRHHIGRLQDFVERGEHITDIRSLQGFIDIIILDSCQDIVSYTQVLTSPGPETIKARIRDFLRMLDGLRFSLNTYINLYVKY
jgi:hypothetical protein